jgi:hypothetical protein
MSIGATFGNSNRDLFAGRLAGAPDARREYLEICEASEDYFLVYGRLTDDIVDLGGRRQRAEIELNTIKQNFSVQLARDVADNAIINQRTGVIATLTADIDRLTLRRDQHQKQQVAIAKLKGNIETWLKKLPDDADIIALDPAAPPVPRKNETLASAIERCRLRLRELAADIRRCDAAPIPAKDAIAIALRQLDDAAERGCPNVLGAIASGDPVEWPKARAEMFNDGRHVSAYVVDSFAIMAWLNRDALAAAISSEIEACSNDAAALSAEDRRIAIETALRDMLAVEREEEAFIRMSRDAGAVINRRADADPRAVLMLSGELPR